MFVCVSFSVGSVVWNPPPCEGLCVLIGWPLFKSQRIAKYPMRNWRWASVAKQRSDSTVGAHWRDDGLLQCTLFADAETVAWEGWVPPAQGQQDMWPSSHGNLELNLKVMPSTLISAPESLLKENPNYLDSTMFKSKLLSQNRKTHIKKYTSVWLVKVVRGENLGKLLKFQTHLLLQWKRNILARVFQQWDL